MTISSQPQRTSYACSGTTGPYAFPYRFLENADLLVTRIDATGARIILSLGADYSVSGAGVGGGGNISTTASYADGQVEVWLAMVIDQLASLPSGGPFRSDSVETALDRLTLIDAALAEQIGRALSFPICESFAPLPSAAARALGVLTFDAAGEPLVAALPIIQSLSATIAISGATLPIGGAFTFASGVGALAATLPPLASVADGQWLDVMDGDNNAGVNNITISAAGADLILNYAASSGSYVIDVSNASMRFIARNGSWRAIAHGA
jgi:hypothetical protein